MANTAEPLDWKPKFRKGQVVKVTKHAQFQGQFVVIQFPRPGAERVYVCNVDQETRASFREDQLEGTEDAEPPVAGLVRRVVKRLRQLWEWFYLENP
jgi:hypothetical protein